MFKKERQKNIKKMLTNRKQVAVLELSTLFKVSEVTIRNDLGELEREGFLTRLHGGAILKEAGPEKQDPVVATPFGSIECDANKQQIGKVAASLVNERERIFLGPGTTCYYIAKELLHRSDITVLTNNLYVANVLLSNPYIKVLLTGGQLVRDQYCVVDDMFTKSIESLYLSKAFFSVGGADFSAGYTVSSVPETEIYKQIAERSKEVIMALDNTKFNMHEFVYLGDLDMLPIVISDSKMPESYKEYYLAHNVKILSSIE
jgi:DeoR/GlpR family transcriptional regulator of sugar metabolism